ncbi:MAG TPA: Stk1 family PASTA domain-containing Ser/Thr kinase [Actinomycetota bacterium]|nr:Stk1 family PASTA domain-containing Ser/Thr kinase [Actinomycetota bacterium]
MERQTIGERYSVEARIGQGGMAEVFRGFDPSLDRTVAIKVLVHPFDRDAGFVARFRREAQAAARLNHPNIVGVYDAGADGDTQYIVMEYIEGRTLASFLAGGGLPTATQAVELAEKVASALQAAHEHGIIHRDIKPANVMVTRAGAVKVMDFGIARVQTDATAPQTSSVIGTPAYFSPEQAQGQPVDARSDIYSLGCVLYEMLAHHQAFTGDTPVAIAYKQVNETPPPPSASNPDVPPRLDAVVMKCLAKNPANRYQTAGELIADLERVRQGIDVEATPLLPVVGDATATQVIARQPTEVMPPPEPEQSSRRVWLGVLIGALIVALLGVGGYLLAQSLGADQATTKLMPDVRTKQYTDAKALLTSDQYQLDVVKKDKITDTVPAGQVVAQSITPNDPVQPGTTVILTVAEKPPTILVPSLRCETLEEAQNDLPNGLSLGAKATAATADTSCPDGTIIDQDPAAGDQAQEGTLVNVTLNPSAPTTVTLDDYTCTAFPKAKNELARLGLVVAYQGTTTPLAQCPNPNFVALQNPGPGTTVPVGSTVDLYTGSASVSPSPTESASP